MEKGSEDYAGMRPFSERESRALVKLVFTVHPQAVINYHTTGHVIYYKEDTELVKLMAKITGYRLQKEDESVNGNFGDWLSEIGTDWCRNLRWQGAIREETAFPRMEEEPECPCGTCEDVLCVIKETQV